MRTEKRKVWQEVTAYVSDDGLDFGQDERACFKHELYLRKKKEIEAAGQLELKELNGTMPITVDCVCRNDCSYRWFYMANEDEFNVVKQAYDEDFPIPSSYPEIICVVTSDGDTYVSDAQGYLLSYMKDSTADFWNSLGYEIFIEKKTTV